MGDCDDRQGLGHGFAGPCHVARALCAHPDCDILVCDNCRDDTQAILRLEPPPGNSANFRRIGNPRGYTPTPPLVPAGNPPEWPGSAAPVIAPPALDPPWPGFLTRVCDKCERELQSLRRLYSTRAILPPPTRAQMQNYPQNTCTCWHTLGVHGHGPRRCLEHRRRIWTELEGTKNRNDRWLRNTERTPTGQIRPARQVTKDRRRALTPAPIPPAAPPVAAVADTGEATWRGCRCGRTVERTRCTGAAAGYRVRRQEVWLCMACEGYVGIIPPVHSTYAGTFITQEWRLRQRNRLGRPYTG